MDLGWPDSPGAPVPVRESVEVLEGALGGALLTAPGEKQPGALVGTHQGLLLYPNPALYWEDWLGSLSPPEESPRGWLPMLPLWAGSKDPYAYPYSSVSGSRMQG